MNMRIYIVSVLMFLIVTQTPAGNISAAETLSPLQSPLTAEQISAHLAKYNGVDGVLLEVEISVEHSGSKGGRSTLLQGSFGKDWKYSITQMNAYLIVNPQATFLTSPSFREKYKKMQFQVFYPDGATKSFSSIDMVTTKEANGIQTYRMTFPNVTPGTIVVLTFQNDFKPSLLDMPWEESMNLQFGIPCEKLHITYVYPEWWEVQVKRIGADMALPLSSVIDTNTHRVILSYSAENIPAYASEAFSPPVRYAGKYFDMQVTHFQMQGTTYDVNASWDICADKLRTTWLKKANKRSTSVEKIVDSLIAPADSSLVKINAIISYIYHTIVPSFIDNNGDPGKTIKSKKGNSYDITNLALIMLSYAGFDGEFIVVHNGSDGFFDPLFISPKQFFMPAIKLHVDGHTIPLFPAYRYLPTSILLPQYCTQDAMSMRENANPRFWTLPNDTLSSSMYTDVYTIHIDSTELHVQSKQRMEDIAAYAVRREFTYGKTAKNEADLKQRFTPSGDSCIINSFQMSNDTTYQLPLEITSDITVKNSVTYSPSEITVHTDNLFPFYTNGRKTELAESRPRNNDVYIPNPVVYDRTFLFTFPDGWHLATIPSPETTRTIFGKITSEWKTSTDGIEVHQLLTLNRGYQPKEKYPELLALMGNSSKAAIPNLILTKTP